MEAQIHIPSRPLTRDELIHEKRLLDARIDQLETALGQEITDREMAETERNIAMKKLEARPPDESHWIIRLNGLMVHVQFWGPGIRAAAATAERTGELYARIARALLAAARDVPFKPKTAA